MTGGDAPLACRSLFSRGNLENRLDWKRCKSRLQGRLCNTRHGEYATSPFTLWNLPCLARVRRRKHGFAGAAVVWDLCRLLNSLEISRIDQCPSLAAPEQDVVLPRFSVSLAALQSVLRGHKPSQMPGFPMNSMTGSGALLHRRSPPDCRNARHALLDKGANPRLCHGRQEVPSWSTDCD